MKRNSTGAWRNRHHGGYTLPEVIIAVALVGMMIVSLFAGFSAGFAILRSTRESMRATQILVQRTEAIRLYNWHELVYSNDFRNTTFIESYDPLGALSGEGGGTVYAGNIQIESPSAWPAAYRDDVRLVTISIYWTNSTGGQPVTLNREMQTVVARHGMRSLMEKR